jgi:hypothetical protein
MLTKHTLLAVLSFSGAAALTTTVCGAQESADTAITIYSSATPGAVSPELYRPVPGQGNQYGRSVPGYGVVRQLRTLQLQQGMNELRFSDVAAYIDPTTVNFTSLTDPGGTRVLDQSFQFDLVNAEKLLERYIDQRITVDQGSGTDLLQIEGRLLSASGGLILAGDDGQIHAIRSYSNIHFPDLPGGLMTRPTLLWNVATDNSGEHDTRVSYQTSGLTWWADYNLVYSEGDDANSGYLDFGAWVSILNRSGASYDDARLKLIAGDVNRAQPPSARMVMAEMDASYASDLPSSGFAEKSFFEFHLYTLGRTTTIPDNSTKQIELMPRVNRVAANKRLVYYGLQPNYGWYGSPATERDLGLPMNTKVDVYLEFDNDEEAGLGVPLPAGRIRVSQLDTADNTLELVGEDVIDHTPRDETVVIKLGSAFDVVGERRQVDFRVNYNAEWMEETIEVTLRNHKDSDVDVLVKETMFRWTNNDILDSNQTYERQDARTVHFPVTVAADGETVVRYRVRYSW